MTLESYMYTGTVVHRRYRPVNHTFKFDLFMMYLDLAELPGLFDGYLLWSARRPALAWFRRSDHFGDPEVSLDTAVRGCVEKSTGQRPDGPIRLLTHLRYGGYISNPVSVYYCFDANAEHIEALLLEVTNTPWGERHVYVVAPTPHTQGASISNQFAKALHVSPFMSMDLTYQMRSNVPGEKLNLSLAARRADDAFFDAELNLRRQPISASRLAGSLLRYPFMTAGVTAGIYWQALRLRLKGVPFVPHPRRSRDNTSRR